MGHIYDWKILGDDIIKIPPYVVVGILNVTPDSFFDGGRYKDREKAIMRVQEMIEQGVNVIDIGGESTRPFSERIDAQEELRRVIPVLEWLCDNFKDIVVSVDTYKAIVANEALKKGAKIINDVSACRFDPDLMDIICEYKPGYVLMHSKGRPEDMQKDPKYDDVVSEIMSFFEENLKKLTAAGLPEENIVIDPGIGFGKTLEHNLEILSNIEKFFEFGRPIYMGLSNKSMWEKLLGLPKEDRETATQVATALLATKGVYIHRVHNVKKTRETLKIVEAFKSSCNTTRR